MSAAPVDRHPAVARAAAYLPGATRSLVTIASATIALLAAVGPLSGQADANEFGDRGPGIATSMFATYITPGEVILYPFFEFYSDEDAEYSPAELGYGLLDDYRGRYIAREGLIFLGYGISDRLAVEFEAAIISARQHRSPADSSNMPASIHESGLGDVEGQLRWRWTDETSSRPEIFSYFETVVPLQKDRVLIGTRDWEFKLGTGLVRGRSWGTTTIRGAVAYDRGEDKVELGEYALEYMKQLTNTFRGYAAIEGSEDEVELLTELQIGVRPGLTLKLNSAFGLTSKATDWAPEVGVLFRFR